LNTKLSQGNVETRFNHLVIANLLLILKGKELVKSNI